ncbi:hypothetical protein Cgig2_033076 [Carnegiea gigantea]|uniref:Uncharacterized protein n=1 Tax=Carnegiea gigantea TaxID=171969 RepID=A0A9Q1JJD5_9CARY|nr:hypothetical protein Cgig2_016209 [Carnegiea gigantea]KAJ8421098.1 hypothetical protein Cgig2_033076 [Carnegiea gigantea]
MAFASFLKFDVKQIPRNFSKLLVESFDPYAVCFRLLDGQTFPATPFDVHATLVFNGHEYNKVHAAWLKEWKLQKNNPELTRMPDFILTQKDRGDSFKRNFIIYLIASLDWCKFIVDKLITSVRHYKESTAAKGRVENDLCAPSFSPALSLDKPVGEAEILGDTLVSNASIIVKKEEHHEDVVLDQPKSVTKKDHSMPSCSLGLGLSQPDSQSPVPYNTSVPNLSATVVNEDDGIEDDNDSAPLRFPLRNTSQVNRELSVKKPADRKPKEGNEPASKKGETTGSKVPSPHNAKEPAGQSKQALGAARTPEKLAEVGPSGALKKQQPENLSLAYCSSYVIRLTKLNNELSQDKLTISEYVFGKVEDVANSEPLFDSCGDKEATGVSMVTLRPGEQLKKNVIDI